MQNTKNENQTYIDFTANMNSKTEYYPRLSSLNHPVYHKEASSILNDRFSIKITYEKRSYVISGTYGISRVKNYIDSDFSGSRISYVHIDKVLHFQNSFYIRHFITKKEEMRFSKIVSNILSDIKYNSNLELK
ncbi:MAG: hypothetical protein PHS92_00165 [Candidatus Gracilibacteria bacterium]|nr:hypothetical protein [Candidatus Gracilibacteria bacterium]